MFIPDPYEKTVKLFVKYSNGRIILYDGLPLPALKEGTLADLVVPAYALRDDCVAELLQWEMDVFALRVGTELLAKVNLNRVPKERREQLVKVAREKMKGAMPDIHGVIMELAEPLQLRLIAGKRAEMLPCKVRIPELDNQEADSINHAYAIVSAAFEANRRTPGGNGFLNVYYPAGTILWDQLDGLRGRLERVQETQVRLRLLQDALAARWEPESAWRPGRKGDGLRVFSPDGLVLNLERRREPLEAAMREHGGWLQSEKPSTLLGPEGQAAWAAAVYWAKASSGQLTLDDALEEPSMPPECAAAVLMRLLIEELDECDVFAEPVLQVLSEWAVGVLSSLWGSETKQEERAASC
jgi:hypothetical protein